MTKEEIKVVSTRTNTILSTIAIIDKLYPNDKILKNYINKISVDVFKITEKLGIVK